MRIMTVILGFLVLLSSAHAQTESPPRPAKDRLVVGVIERVIVFPGNFLLHAKVDTGARTSSLNAQDITTTYRQGERYVRFSVTNREGRTATFQQRVVRHVRIKEVGAPSQRRPVIRLGICLGNVFRETEISLADRSNFNFQLLVGRKFMSQRVIVDPSLEYTATPSCPNAVKAADSRDKATK
ncbi:MAG: RimK/LysX family protein [Alphaproteobacteria bacterium]|nr:RimK/LysX family protein [Alphaproteobacteria bacterium]